ncbi:MAG: bifunctional 5,10-methylenetetrahydrofolate dehydrogenase/5,10-methenyltetrahydrofolate cyclohydrolase, partial [Anaerovoracaceae bacterium]
MTELLKGKDVVEALNQRLAAEVKTLISAGVTPTLALVRVGENPGDLAYERGAKKRAEAVGVTTLSYVFPQEVSQEELMEAMVEINGRKDIHGALIFRPLPGHLDEEEIRMTLDPAKDVDGITDGSMAGVYSHRALGFPPCTAEACMEILDHYGIALEGKKAVVLGRSLVIGKPVAMMLMAKNATVTLCHSKTQNPEALAKDADILIAAMGRGRSVGAEYF